MRRCARAPLVAAASIVALGACRSGPSSAIDASSGAQNLQPTRNDRPDELTSCAAMREVVGGDRVVLDGDVLYHLDEAEGLGITNVADADAPRDLARVPFVGTPIALHSRPPLAWIAYVDWDARAGARTVARVVDVERPEAPKVLGEAVVPGIAAGTALVGGVFYVLAGTPATLRSYRVDGGRLAPIDTAVVPGAAAALAASPAGLGVVATTERGLDVSWIDLPLDDAGALVVRGRRAVDGGFPAWERDLADADEGGAVRLVTCATPACGPDDDVFVRVVDFSGGGDAIRSSAPVSIGRGVPVARFSGDRLYAVGGSRLRIVELHPAPRVLGAVPLPGTIAALRARGSSVVAIGTVGSPSTTVRVTVSDVDVRDPAAPRLRGTATFGASYTWTPAADDDRAISIDEANDRLALPFSTWQAERARYASGALVVDLGARGPVLRGAWSASGHVERAVFVRGRLLAVGGGRVATLRRTLGEELEVR